VALNSPYAGHLRNGGPRPLQTALEFRFSKIDAANFELGLDVKLPFGISVREDLSCVSSGPDQCRVGYYCGFGFPAGWRGCAGAAPARQEAGILLNEHLAEDGSTLFALRANLAPSAKCVDGVYRSLARAASAPRSAIPPSPRTGTGARIGTDDRLGPGRSGMFLDLSVGKQPPSSPKKPRYIPKLRLVRAGEYL
jgi:hypothetical protein